MTARFAPPDRTLLVLGGARSGKSRHAQRLAEAAGGALTFIATAQSYDTEMADRIARHRADRDARWRTVDAPLALAEAIRAADDEDATLLIDCLTLWTSNLLLAEADWDAALADLVAAVAGARGRLFLVTNEVGWGIVPDNALARRFRDMAGTVNQRVAAACNRVHLVAAGLALQLK
jgi:adenosylcobinamide kinase / adenosylcobinamide-phosphate guanylyltransferase